MNKKVTIVISAVFLLIVFVLCIGTLILHGKDMAYGFFVSYKDQLSDDSDFFDVVDAKVYKLNYNAENRLMGRNQLRQLNARFQMLLGKDIIEIGGHMMTRLEGAGYYDIFTDAPDMTKAAELAEMLKATGKQAVFLYCHSGLYEDGLLDNGIAELDTNNEFADELKALFEQEGITFVDSRETYKRSGFTLGEAIHSSDVHWSHRMALAAAQDTARAAGLDYTKLDYSQFEDEYYSDLLLGEYGRRLGRDLTGLDDIHVLYPKYETNVLYEEINTEVRREGSFKEAVIFTERLERNEDGYNEDAYYIYGDYLAQKHIHNDAAEDKTVLMFTDSYGSPASVFMGLTARDVYSIDLRSTQKSMAYWVETIQPDIVIIAYSQQMLRDFDYVIE